MKIRKVLSVVLSCVMSFCLIFTDAQWISTTNSADTTEEDGIHYWDGTADISWYDDQETEFHIYTVEQFAGISKLTNESKKNFTNKTIYIESDLYFNKVYDHTNKWETIKEFRGFIEGNNHFLYNLSGDALMGICLGIRNIRIINSCIRDYTICRSLYGDMTNCYVSGNGALCNELNRGTIKDCVFNGKIEKPNSYGVAGICNTAHNGVIENCSAYGSITIDGSSAFRESGGIVGHVTKDSSGKSSFKIINCSNYMDITSSTIVGGIIGSAWPVDSLVIINCYNHGVIESTSDSYSTVAGGIVGSCSCSLTFENCYNTGTIIGEGEKVGGLCGTIGKDTKMIIEENKPNYYLNTSATIPGQGLPTSPESISKSEKNMKTSEFASGLGDAYVYNPGSYPRLAFENINTFTNISKRHIIFDSFDKTEQLRLYDGYDGEITWISSNPNVAIVDKKGSVTPVSNGNAIIYALYGNSQAICDVMVCSYEIKNKSMTVSIGEQETIVIVSNNKEISSSTATFSSSDSQIATVNKKGIVTGIKEGECFVNIKIGDVSIDCKITVNKKEVVITTTTAPPEPQLNKVKLTLNAGNKEELSITNYSENITWVSSDTNVAKVISNSGSKATIEGIGAGTATIYAMLSSGKNLTCEITVKKPATITTTTATTTTTTTTTKKPTTTSTTTTKKTTTTTTTTKKTTTTTTTTKKPTTTSTTTTKKTTTTTTTTKKPTTTSTTTKSPSITPPKLTIEINTSSKLTITNVPTGVTIIWTSDNPGVATVDNGNVKGISPGTATIYAIVGDKVLNCVVTVNGSNADKGDANGDGQVNMADAVFIMQCISNPDKYKLTETGRANADVDGSGDITNKDALLIQRFRLGLISKL